MSRAWCGASRGLVVAAVLAISSSARLAAQRAPVANQQAKAAPNTSAVRAELAAVLLQSKKYDDAIREYRALLARDSLNVGYRLALARAYAWSDRHRDAERELRVLQSHGVRSAAVDSLMHSVREAIDPTSTEAAAWVAERRDYAPYRLALARALVNEHNGWLAAAQYDTLIARRGTGPVPDALALRREQAAALFDAGDRVAGAASLRRALQLSPRDTALRYELAVALSGDERATPQLTEALAHYDTLLARAPSASRFAERARLHLIMSDTAAAEHDLEASIKLHPDASAYVTLGDIAREHGDYARARVMYYAALSQLQSWNRDGGDVRTAIARVDRDDRPVGAFVPAIGDDPGWRMRTDGVSDNLGVYYASSTVGRAITLDDETSAGVAFEHQYIGERSSVRSLNLNAYGAQGSLASGISHDAFMARVGVTGGVLLPPGSRSLLVGDATAAAWLDAWELALETSTGPAYPTLLTTTSLRPLGTGPVGPGPPLVVPTTDDVLTEQDFNFTLGGPLGVFDVAATAQQSRFSDGNHRTTWQGYARYPLAPALYAVYEANRITFAERSTRYWDPIDYIGQSAGLEIGDRSRHGVAWSVSALPGVAWSRELPPPTILDGQIVDRSTNVLDRAAFQLATSAEVGWRTPGWEFNTAASYSLGRIGAYRRLGLTLGLRLLQ